MPHSNKLWVSLHLRSTLLHVSTQWIPAITTTASSNNKNVERATNIFEKQRHKDENATTNLNLSQKITIKNRKTVSIQNYDHMWNRLLVDTRLDRHG